MKYFFYSFSRNILDSFKGRNIWWHIIAIATTAVIVVSGFDWYYFTITRISPLDAFFFPAVIIGAFVPMFGILITLLIGWLSRNKMTKMLAWAVGQAALIGFFVSSSYKALTGRIPPPSTVITDISRQFNFGFLREGIFWGWPSSHTTVAFAMAFVLITLYPKNKIVKFISFIYALYIGVGVSLSIHWFSEFVAGAIIGAVIGIVVGKSFLSKII
jgi:membrane-associated phospholipid phosphatase